MRILMTTDAVGGVWQYATDLAAALTPHGAQTVLAVLGPEPSPAQRAEAEAIRGLELVETGLPLDWMCDSAAPVRAAGKAVAALAREKHVDLVHLNSPALGADTWFGLPVVAVNHGCLSTWWEAARSEPLAPNYRWHRALMRRGLTSADITVAPSAAYAATIARHYRLPDTPVVVHNGRRPLPLPPQSGEAPADFAFTAGRLWDDVKNARTLDRAAALLTVPLRAAGSTRGPHGEEPSLEHLDRMGQIDTAELARTLAQRPIFVSAATFEPFGLAVLEAAAAGCPLVLSDIPTFRELWDGAARFVAPHDAAGFAETIEALRDDPLARRQLGQAARKRSAEYTPAAMAAGMARLYSGFLPDEGQGRAAA